ncbi:flavin reductase family protein [Colwellia sp. D2M02]|uniref:flavin reductase family protein n=1 Tax=Colwellia sp. D2M02 TaxID=2841562 RepID=UPI001C09832A|nr:flavin reductase family protein [Colwellia sp. D2M02]MBU2892632.1 flavin reductase family protein [Colwellia sp. D2M02]
MNIDFSDCSASQRYHLMTQTIIPRPIAWALTSSSNANADPNSLNLAPFSYFTAVSSDPALLMLSLGKKPNGESKDTLTNVLKNKKMVIHIAGENLADIVTQTAASLAHGESELATIPEGVLNTVPFEGFALPRIAQCDIAYGCELYEIKEIGEVAQTLIFVEIKQLYVSAKVTTVNDGRIKIAADSVNPLARLGASEYSGITAPFKKTRPA